MISRDIAGLTESNLVEGRDSELVLSIVHQALHQKLRGLELLWDVAFGPVFYFSSFALHQVADDLTATIIRWLGPAQANGGLGRVHYFREGRRPRRI